MQIIKMRRTGRRLAVSDRRADLFIRMKVADPYDLPVVKVPLQAQAPVVEPASEPEHRRTARRYRRRDMGAEGE